MPGVDARVITQNVDGLHSMTRHSWDWEERLIEAHGRLGLYKCIPETDSDTDSESDEEEERKVKLGSRRKSRALRAAYRRGGLDKIIYLHEQHDNDVESYRKKQKRSESYEMKRVPCKYEIEESIPVHMIGPSHVRRVLAGIYPSETTSSEELSDSTQAKIHLPEIESNENLSSSASDSVSSENSSFLDAATKIDKQTSSSLQVKPRMRRRRFIRSKYKKSHPANDSTPTTPIQISDPPLCPSCHRPCPPQALLFDEGYHSHCHYQFERMERWIEQATTIVFVGTSFAVSLTDCVLEHARRERKLVYNFNIDGGALESTAWLNVENVVGDVQRTLPALVKACEEESMRRDCDGSGEDSFLSWT